ncbi:MAG TPA: hypothetical protein VGE17_04090 [Methylophilus sp.]
MLLTLWFALLQTVAPLMHAHAVAEDDADDGPHMHMVSLDVPESRDDDSTHVFHWHVHASKAESVVIGLAQAITEKNWLQSLIDLSGGYLLAAILPMALLFAAPTAAVTARASAPPALPTFSCLTRRHAPRAPPAA